MALEITGPRSRRAILAGAIGAAAATAVGALGRPSAATATNGQSIVLGTFASDTDGTGPNAASSTTKIIASAGAAAFAAESAAGYGLWGLSVSNSGVRGTSSSGAGVYGASTSNYGVYATSTQGFAIYAFSPSNVAVYAYSATGVAIDGNSTAPDKPGIHGQSTGDATAIVGYSGPAAGPGALPRTGVYGVANQDGTAVGIRGDTTTGGGVVGFSGSGTVSIRAKTGVYGQANHGSAGIGVRGHSGGGSGGYFSSTTGTSLRATGRVKLDKCAGIATVTSGANSVVVTPGIDLVSTSAVVASLMGSAGGTTTVHRSVVNATANTFTIFLTANASANVKVGWHVFE